MPPRAMRRAKRTTKAPAAARKKKTRNKAKDEGRQGVKKKSAFDEFEFSNHNPEELAEEYARIEEEFEAGGVEDIHRSADVRYAMVACHSAVYGFNPNSRLLRNPPSRSPYLEGQKMGRGAAFAKRFREYIEGGGVAKYKNTVVMNVRLNDLRDIDSANGNGTFRVSFFLDVAFWVPWFDHGHFVTQKTVGTFTKYEPVFEFPKVDHEAGDLRWGRRSAEFSGGSGARQHEVQLGQNYETAVFVKGVKGTVSVADPGSHWPRMWRVCLNDDEIAAMANMDKKERKKLEPTNDLPRQVNPRLANLFTRLDAQREHNLPHPDEGIAFVTHEVHCLHRSHFQLNEFPFDMHDLKIVVRLNKQGGDPMDRTIIPVAHDKGFFVSSRVAKNVDFHLARNLDWEVSKEPVNLGGFQRLNASAIVRRKPGYFVRNYAVVVFLLTTLSFCVFICRPDDYSTRVVVAFTSLLAMVAFKYSGGEGIPQVPYPTLLDAYIFVCFFVLLVHNSVCFAFMVQCTMGGIMSGNRKRVMKDVMCSKNPGHWYGFDWVPPYDPRVETAVGLLFFWSWIYYNYRHWTAINARVQFNLNVVDVVGIGWMSYKYKGPKGMKGMYNANALMFDPLVDAAEKDAAAAAKQRSDAFKKPAKGPPATPGKPPTGAGTGAGLSPPLAMGRKGGVDGGSGGGGGGGGGGGFPSVGGARRGLTRDYSTNSLGSSKTSAPSSEASSHGSTHLPLRRAVEARGSSLDATPNRPAAALVPPRRL